MRFRGLRKLIILLLIPIALAVFISGTNTYATGVTPDTDPEEGVENAVTDDENDGFSVGLTLDSNSDETRLAGTLRMLLVITVISIAPSILVMLTSFTRIIVVLHFVRTAVGTQSSPPNNVLIGLSLFLTLFIMSPVFVKINDEAIKPLSAQEITQEEAVDKAITPLREFMLRQVRQEDLRLFMDIARMDTVDDPSEIPTTVIIPAFIISELRAAFIIGFLIYIPFIIIDMVVASILMAMGMMMLPPVQISMPFKLILFVLVDGWGLLTQQLFNSVIR